MEKELEFEGEYINGKRWNGKVYNAKDNMDFEFKNGKGYIKEYYYYNGQLKYEGEYLNGKRNGKGKQYNENGNLLFEGEYLNNKRWNGNVYNPYRKIKFELKNGNGNIKEYYNNGKIEFEGEYLNGEKNGKGKEYDRKGNLLFEGEYLNNKRWNGKEYEYGFYEYAKYCGGIPPYFTEYVAYLKFKVNLLNGKKKVLEKNIIDMVI